MTNKQNNAFSPPGSMHTATFTKFTSMRQQVYHISAPLFLDPISRLAATGEKPKCRPLSKSHTGSFVL